ASCGWPGPHRAGAGRVSPDQRKYQQGPRPAGGDRSGWRGDDDCTSGGDARADADLGPSRHVDPRATSPQEAAALNRGAGPDGSGRYPRSMAADASWLRDHVRNIPDYPRTGVTFRDITPLLGDPDAFRFAIDAIADRFSGVDIDRVIGIEARGFIL